MVRKNRTVLPFSLAMLASLVLADAAFAKTSHKGWPRINGMLLMNKNDSSRPLDARPGHDPFGGQDPAYLCDTIHKRRQCRHRLFRRADGRYVVSRKPAHNKLLGGHGSDTIFAGPWGDVIWGDYKPSGQPESQHDRIFGGRGRDHIYASHGRNTIYAGGGNDWLKAHWGRGLIDCGRGRDLLYVSRRNKPLYRIRNCERISHKTLGY